MNYALIHALISHESSGTNTNSTFFILFMTSYNTLIKTYT